MKDVGLGISVERFLLPPFGKLTLPPVGPIAYVSGNVAWLGFEEGSDVVPLWEGHCLPMNARGATLLNPFSYTAEVSICRGLAPAIVQPQTDLTLMNPRQYHKAQGSIGYQLPLTANGGQAGKKRGMGMIAKRGRYYVNLSMTSSDTNQLMIFPAANAVFADLRAGGVMSDELPVYRYDGTLFDQIRCIGGYYTDADITAWKAAAGYTLTEVRKTVYTGTGHDLYFSEDTAVFWNSVEATSFKVVAEVTELGDRYLERR